MVVYLLRTVTKRTMSIISKEQILALIIGIIAMTLAYIFFGWKLVLVLMLALWGNNIDLIYRYRQRKNNEG